MSSNNRSGEALKGAGCRAQAYRAFGLVIASDLPLPELEPIDAGAAPDLHIRLRHIAQTPPDPDRSHYSYGVAEQFLYWPTVGSFLIRSPGEIDIDPAPGASEGLVRLPLLGPVIALLLHIRGSLVLHASAVSVAGRVVAFVGDKGAGKSTTTAAAIELGHRLFTDDLLAISTDDGRALASPGFPSVKLVTDCANLFDLQGARVLPAPTAGFPKQLRRLTDAFTNRSSEIATIYVLERSDRSEVLASTRDEALRMVMRYAYVPLFDRKPWAPEETQRHFSQCARVAASVRVARLVTPSHLGRLGEIIGCIEEDLSRLSAPRVRPVSRELTG